MGSFDVVCGLSNMAVAEGDPVMAMIVRRVPVPVYDTGPLFPFTMWEPASVMVETHYNDYGGVKLTPEQEAAWGLTTQHARKWRERTWLPPSDEDGKPYQGRWYLRDVTLPESFPTTGERPPIHADKDDETSQVHFGMWMAHRGVWDRLVKEVMGEFSDEGTVAQMVEQTIFKNRQTMKGEGDDILLQVMREREPDARQLRRSIRYASRNLWSLERQGVYFNPVLDYLENAIWDAAEADNTEAFDAAIQYWRNTVLLAELLRNMRRLLVPPGNIGPQHGHDQPLLVLADAIVEQAGKNRARWEDEDD